MKTMRNPWDITVGAEAEAGDAACPVSSPGPPRRCAPAGRQRIEGTVQQEAFWEELLKGSGHMLLEARAGAGKSSSCREGMWRLLERDRRLAIRYCSFNKKVADEFAERCPPGAEAGTMHRFGKMALETAFGSLMDKNKSYTILDGIGGSGLKGYYRRAISRLVGLAKNHGLRPDSADLPLDMDEFIDRFDIEVYRQRSMVIDWAVKVLARSAEMTSLIDYDDMLWLAVLHPVRFPNVDFLFIDECQDLNPVQHEMAERLSGSGRTIVVGDPNQSIYAFRGADSGSMPKLRDKLGARVMPLTVSFRCPRSHVELARRLVPDFEAAPGAPAGVLLEAGLDAIDAAKPGDLVLCRANAPVIQACLRQIANLVPSIVRGRSIGDSLLTVVRKVGDVPTIPDFVRGLDRWRSSEVMRLEAKDGCEDMIEQVMDKAMGLDAVASACSSPAEIPGVIQRLFADDDSASRVTFSSVHRAKGSEARNVSYIQIPYSEKRDRDRPPQEWERGQRRNLRYVALTRSLESLTLIA